MGVDDLEVAVHEGQVALHFANQGKGGLHQALQLLDVALHGRWRRRTGAPNARRGHLREDDRPLGRQFGGRRLQ